MTLYSLIDCILLASSIHEIFQARILAQAPFSTPENLPDLGIEPSSLCPSLAHTELEFFTMSVPENPMNLL